MHFGGHVTSSHCTQIIVETQQVTYIIPEPGPPPPLPEVLRTLFTQQKLDSVMSLILAFILLQGAYIHTYKTTVINVNLPSTSLVQKCV